MLLAEPERASSHSPPRARRKGRDAEGLRCRFPPTAAGSLEIALDARPGAWLKERLVGGLDSVVATLSSGRLVYPGAIAGIDRVYEVSVARSEEYLRIADASAAERLEYEVELGPAIDDLVTDGSGAGLIAKDSAGRTVLKASQPVGMDARGERVEGSLLATRTGPGRFSVRVRITTARSQLTYPVLLDPGWMAAGAMSLGRSHHTATLLSSGSVLVVGGEGDLGATASVEIYDPISNSWRDGAPLHGPATSHTATRLPDGKVLVAGGYGSSDQGRTTELYDLESNTWQVVGAMVVPRQDHSATMLPNGKILFFGGKTDDAQATVAEIYDPVSHMSSPTPAISPPRYDHSSTRLLDGRVLIAGGVAIPTTAVASAILYDAATDTWTSAASMASVRSFFTATVLKSGKVYVAGGDEGAGHLAELYDPVDDTWSTASIVANRMGHTATTLRDGKILLAGGGDITKFPDEVIADAELYDPVSNTSSAIESLVTGRIVHTATALTSGDVLLVGGSHDLFDSLASAELYDDVLEQPSGSPCSTPSDCSSATCVGGVCCETTCQGDVSTCVPCGSNPGAGGAEGESGAAGAQGAAESGGTGGTSNTEGPSRLVPASDSPTAGCGCRTVHRSSSMDRQARNSSMALTLLMVGAAVAWRRNKPLSKDSSSSGLLHEQALRRPEAGGLGGIVRVDHARSAPTPPVHNPVQTPKLEARTVLTRRLRTCRFACRGIQHLPC